MRRATRFGSIFSAVRLLCGAALLVGVGPSGCDPALIEESGTVTALSQFGTDLFYAMSDSSTATKRIKKVAIGSTAPTQLAPFGGVDAIDTIKVDASGLYFSATLSGSKKPGIYYLPVTGGTSAIRFEGATNDTFVDFELANPVYFIHQEALAGGATRSWIKRVPKTGPTAAPTNIVGPDAVNDINQLAIDTAWVYYSSCRGGTIRRFDRFNNPVNQPVVSGRGCVTNLETDGTYLFWMETLNGAVYRSDIAGTNVTQLYPGNSKNHKSVVPGMVDSDNYYWVDVEDNNINDSTAGATIVRKVPKAGGPATVLADNIGFTTWTQDTSFLYVGRSEGIWKIRKVTSEPQPLACENPTTMLPGGSSVFGTTTGNSTLSASISTPDGSAEITSATSASPEKVFKWTATQSGTTTIETCSTTNTNFDTIIYVRDGNCASGTEIKVNDDTAGCGTSRDDATNPHTGSRITFNAIANRTYYFVVDGYNSNGSFQFRVQPPAPANQPPNVNVGDDITLTLPSNTVTLTSTSSDPDGTIVSRLWEQLPGSPNVMPTVVNTPSLTLRPMGVGTYSFRLTVTDNGGASRFDDLTVTVLSQNSPPVVNLQLDVTTSPGRVNLSAFPSDPEDPDNQNNTLTFLWQQVAGSPNVMPTIVNQSELNTKPMPLGTYRFRLTVTDPGGLSAFDEVTVTVVATPDNPTLVTTVGRDPTDGNYPGDASMSGRLIVWTDYRNANADVYLYDLDDPAAGAQRITTNSSAQVGPVISGTRIVWVDDRSGAFVPGSEFEHPNIPEGATRDSDLYFCDYNRTSNTCSAQTPVPVPASARAEIQTSPHLSGNLLVFLDFRDGLDGPNPYQNQHMYLYDFGAARETKITLPGDLPWSPHISGNRIVWMDHRNNSLIACEEINGVCASDGRFQSDIYSCVYNAASTTSPCPAEAITTPAANLTLDTAIGRLDVNISGNNIVWTQRQGFAGITDATQVWLYNVVTRNPIKRISAANSSVKGAPQISGNLVTWTDYRNFDWGITYWSDIYSYNIQTGFETRVSHDVRAEFALATDGTRIVGFKDNQAAGLWGLYLY